jgi:hypothetical protein
MTTDLKTADGGAARPEQARLRQPAAAFYARAGAICSLPCLATRNDPADSSTGQPACA